MYSRIKSRINWLAVRSVLEAACLKASIKLASARTFKTLSLLTSICIYLVLFLCVHSIHEYFTLTISKAKKTRRSGFLDKGMYLNRSNQRGTPLHSLKSTFSQKPQSPSLITRDSKRLKAKNIRPKVKGLVIKPAV